MQLTLSNLLTKVVANEDETAWLYEYLSFDDAKARFWNKKFTKSGDTRRHLYSLFSKTFPGGFTQMVYKAAKDQGFDVNVIDLRIKPITRDTSADLNWLRDYQFIAVRAAAKRTRGILWLPTGAGKTEIAVGLAVAFPCRWLFLVHRENLMHQAADRYVKRTGAVVGRIGDGRWEEERFTAATFQTLHGALKDEPKNSTNPKTIRARKFLQGIQGVIIDESHTVAADTFYEVTRQIPNAYYRIGISGTPLARDDRRSLLAIGTLGPVIYRLRPEVLIERGLLAKPDIKMVKAPAVSRAPTFQGAYGEGIVRNTKRNQIITQVAQVAAKPALVFVKEIKHGKALLQRFQQAGLNAEFVWGTTMTPSRIAAIERLVRADIDVLICSVVLQEGADIPELKSVIVAAAGKSVIATLQRIGRGMRTAEGKGNTFQVWDFIDEGNRMLIKHSHARKNAYEREGHDVTVISALSVTKTDAPEPS